MPIYVPDEKLPQLQEWLAEVLDPLTPADPATLAEYVLTLLKHDKNGSELRKHCVDQLYDFLKENTETFVSDLFSAIQDESYCITGYSGENAHDEEDDSSYQIDYPHNRLHDEDDTPHDRASSRRREHNEDFDDDNESSFRKRRKGDDGRETDVPARSLGSSHSANNRIQTRDRERDREHGSLSNDRNHGNRGGVAEGQYQGGRGNRHQHGDSRFPPQMDMSRSNMGFPFATGPYLGMPMGGFGPYVSFPGPMHGAMGMGYGGSGYGMMPPPGAPQGSAPSGPMGYPPGFLSAQPSNQGQIGTQGLLHKPAPPTAPKPLVQSSTADVNAFTNSMPSGGPSAPPMYNNNTRSMQLPHMHQMNQVNDPFGPQHSQAGPGWGGKSSSRYNSSEGNNNNGGYNSLPEFERFTLKCTGIPSHVSETELRKHFKQFGRIVLLQLNVNTSVTTDSADKQGGASGGEKKVYNECLVQFANCDDAKKCFSSPMAVLNNRFIRLHQADFNVIPPADVPEPTEEELAEEDNKESAAGNAGEAPLSGRGFGRRGGSNMGRGGRGLGRAGAVNGRFSNKRYVAGQTDVGHPSTSVTPSATTAVTALKSHVEAGDQDAGLVEGLGADSMYADIPTAPTGDDATASTESTYRPPTTYPTQSNRAPISAAAKAATEQRNAKDELVLTQKFEELKKLRTEADSIWKKKEELLQGQIEQYKTMISKLDSSSETVENLETKILNLQGQLQTLRDQREKAQQTLGSAGSAGRIAPSESSYNPGRGSHRGSSGGRRGSGRSNSGRFYSGGGRNGSSSWHGGGGRFGYAGGRGEGGSAGGGNNATNSVPTVTNVGEETGAESAKFALGE